METQQDTQTQQQGPKAWPKVAIIVLNWNGWQDTIECLESVFRSDYPDYRVIVCDNNSHDESLDHIKAWAEGRLGVAIPIDSPVYSLSYPPIPKPVPYVEYDRANAEKGGRAGDDRAQLVLIQTGANLGFAGGNNVGLRYALARGDFDYAWLLNNDTVVQADTLKLLVQRMQGDPTAGICGSKILCYHQPNNIQALGGAKYSKLTFTCTHLGLLSSAEQIIDPEIIESEMDYVVGSSMLVTHTFLKDVGLMSEDYFLFFEEIDWAMRARRRNYTLAFAPDSVVYHKVGISTGSSCDPARFSYLADYYINRSRLLFVRKYYPLLIPILYMRFLVALLNRLRRKQFNRIPMILRLMFHSK